MLIKIENRSNSSSRFVSLLSKRWRMEGLRLKEEAIRATEEAEKERKGLQNVEMALMTAEECELERRQRRERPILSMVI